MLLPGELAETVRHALIGRPFGALARIGPLDPFVADQRIAEIQNGFKGSIVVRLDRSWMRVDA